MNYRTLLALQPLDAPVTRLRPLAALARALEAHVDAMVLDLVAPIPTMTFIQDPAYAWNASFPEQLKGVERQAESVRTWLEGEGVEASVIGEAQQLGLLGRSVARAAIASDLVVVTRASESLVDGMMGHALEGALFSAGKPVLVLAHGDAAPPIAPGEVIIAWDGGREAARAVAAALPMLQAAARVRLMIVEESGASELDESARLLRRHLLRHAIDAGVERVAPAGRFMAHAFVEHVDARGPDLLVMGAYGHARLRERLFSGVTRTALSELQAPLLLAH